MLDKRYQNNLGSFTKKLQFCSGYMAPEYATRGHLTDKADVYSFGIVALEIVSGKSNTNFGKKENRMHLLDWVHTLSPVTLVNNDTNFGGQY